MSEMSDKPQTGNPTNELQAGDPQRRKFLPSYYAAPRAWGTHRRRRMLMTPWLVFFGGIFAFAVPTVIGAFWQMMFFNPPISTNFAPLTASAWRGREVFITNGCLYCHSGFVRPQDVRSGAYFLYTRVSLPGDFTTSDSSPNTFGTARIGPDLEQEAGQHPIDWENSHFYDPRYVDPLTIMPRFSFLSRQDVIDLAAFVETRSGKVGLIRESGQEWAKRVFMIAGDGNGAPAYTPPIAYDGAKLTLGQVAVQNKQGGVTGPSTMFDGLPYPDVLSVNMAPRGYWLMDNPFPVTTSNLFRGRWVFQTFCIGCHGQGGSGISEAAKFMAPRPIDFTGPDDASGGNDTSPGIYYYRILRGWVGSAMEPFGQRLSVDDIWKVVLFLKTIPNGTLEDTHVPRPLDYIQWHPTAGLLQYVKLHPIQDQQAYQGAQTGPTVLKEDGTGAVDPFFAEAQRVFPGLNYDDKIPLPGYGTISLSGGATAIRAGYQAYLNAGWAAYPARHGYPVLPASLRTSLPTDDYAAELR
jgi:cytochrome c oxidase cbb3-type subunit II